MISLRHSTIFVHIPKTAGQSIEQVFLDDLNLTWEQRAPLLLRPNRDRQIGPERLAHLFAAEYFEKGFCSQEDFQRFHKFSVVRNPYSRAVSEFNFREAWKLGFTSFRDYCASIPDDPFDDRWRHICPQTLYIRRGEAEVWVDQVLRFEDLENDWEKVCLPLFGGVKALPKKNKSAEAFLHTDTLSGEDRSFIAEKYQQDFEFFGYPI